MHRIVILVASLILIGCDAQGDADAVETVAPKNHLSPIVEVEGLRFGDDFETVLSKFPYDYFNPASVVDCPDEMPFEGCTLFPKRNDPSYFKMIDGIAYDVSLDFDTTAKLDGVNIRYNKDEDISAAQCMAIFERTVDWLASEHGEPGDNPNADPGDLPPAAKTPGGHQYRRFESEDGSIIGNTVFRSTEVVRVFVIGTALKIDERVDCGITAMHGSRDQT